MMVKKEQLTLEAQAELNALAKGTNAFDLLVKNFYANGEGDISFRDVVARLQAQYFALSSVEESLKTISAWDQNEYNEPNEVNRAIPAILGNKYSSFALKDVSEDFEINYPLDDDYSLAGAPFIATDISSSQLSLAYRQLAQKVGIEISESSVASSTRYKTPNKIISGAILKVKNLFLKIAKKPQLTSNIYQGKITLQTKVGGYNVSNVEKLIKAFDAILKKSISRDVKQMKKLNKGKISSEVQYASRLFADILMVRINDLGDIKNNQIAEKCLWLQFSGILNRYGFRSEELSMITELGTMSVVNTCANFGITKEKVIERMTRLGYTYSSVPVDISQALLNVKEKNYNRYNETIDPTPKREQISTFNITPDPEPKRDIPTGLDNETPTPEPKPVVNPVESEVETQTKKAPTTEIIPAQNEVADEEKLTQNIKASTVEKNIDKLVIKFLANVTTTLAEKIDGGKLKGKKLEKTNAQLRLYNLTLAYYVQATHGKPMAVKGEYTATEISKAKVIVKGLLQQKQNVSAMITESSITRGDNQSTTAYMNAVCKQNLNYTMRDYFLKLIKGCVDYCIDEQFGSKKTSSTSDMDDQIKMLVDEQTKYTDYVPDFIIIDDGEQNAQKNTTPKAETEQQSEDYVPNFVFIDDGTKPKNDQGRV